MKHIFQNILLSNFNIISNFFFFLTLKITRGLRSTRNTVQEMEMEHKNQSGT
jgi:hypothetical protein